jgi:hypothetical protein
MDISSTIPSKKVSNSVFKRKLNCAVEDIIGNTRESNTSSEISSGSLVKAEFGELLNAEVTVAHGTEPA